MAHILQSSIPGKYGDDREPNEPVSWFIPWPQNPQFPKKSYVSLFEQGFRV